MNLANVITLIRIFLMPVFVYLIIRDWRVLSLSLFTLLMLTDAVDGIIARATQQCSVIGSVLDPFADKLLFVTTLTVYGFQNKLPWWFVSIVLIRDILIVTGWTIRYYRTKEIGVTARISGKLSVIMEVVVVYTVLLAFHQTLKTGAVILTAIIIFWSIGDHLYARVDWVIPGKKVKVKGV